MSIRSISSPSPGIGSLSLNLGRYKGTASESLRQVREKENLFWVDGDSDKTHNTVYNMSERIRKEYDDIFESCYNPVSIYVYLPEDDLPQVFFTVPIYFKIPQDPYMEKPEAIAKIENCLKNKKIILISLTVIISCSEWSHAILLIINKYTKTIELYDSNGTLHLKNILPHSEEIFSEFLKSKIKKLSSYTFSPIKDTNFPEGFQFYEHCHGYGQEYSGPGFCQTWVPYIAQLRAENYKLEPNTFTLEILKRMDKIYQHSKLSPSKEANLYGRLFSNYIFDYIKSSERPDIPIRQIKSRPKASSSSPKSKQKATSSRPSRTKRKATSPPPSRPKRKATSSRPSSPPSSPPSRTSKRTKRSRVVRSKR